jgi:hypothetical protein
LDARLESCGVRLDNEQPNNHWDANIYRALQRRG